MIKTPYFSFHGSVPFAPMPMFSQAAAIKFNLTFDIVYLHDLFLREKMYENFVHKRELETQ